jgi:cytochrome c
MEKLMFKLSVAAIGVIAALAGTTKAENTTQMIRNGAQAYQLCAGCHSLKFGVHLTGPSLANLWGMRAASISDYVRYTAALKKSDFIWDEITLNAWLANPQLMVPGTAMTFRGIEKDETRDNLIAFLRLALAPDGMAKVVKDGLIPERMAVGQMPPALATVDANQRIKQIRHCRDAYYVTTADGVEFPFWETNVRLKTDTGARGPKTGEPVLLRSGMAGDRVSIVFSNLSEINRLVVEKC